MAWRVFSPDGRRLATSAEFRPDFELWDAATGRRLATLRGHTDRVRRCRVLTRRQANGLRLRGQDRQDLGRGDLPGDPDPSRARRRGVRRGDQPRRRANRLDELGRHGQALGYGDGPGGPHVRGMVQWRRSDYGNAIAFHPDGRWFAAASADGRVMAWDVETGREVHRLVGHSGEVNAVAFSPDGRHIASAGHDGGRNFWDADTGDEVFTLRGHLEGILGLAFSPDGNRIASASADTTVKIWDISSRTLRSSFAAGPLRSSSGCSPNSS